MAHEAGADLSDLEHLRQRLQRARAVQAQQHPRWQQSLDLYRMRFFNRQGLWQPDDDDDLSVNFATTFIKRLLQATYARAPKLYVEARRARYAPFAESMQTVLNYFWEDLDLKNTVIKVYRDALIFGLGWIELGWTDAFDQPPSAAPMPDDGGAKTILDAARALLRGPTPKPEPDGPAQGQLHGLIREGRPFAIRRSPWQVFLPDGFHDLEEMPYLLMTERLRLADFLRDARYTAKDRVAPYVPASSSATTGQMQKPSFTGQPGPHRNGSTSAEGVADTQTVELVHHWDRVEQRYTVFSDQARHLDADWPYYPDGFPLQPLTFNDIPEGQTEAHAYPFGDLEPIFSQLIEKTMCRRQAAAHRKRISTIVFVRKGSATETEVRNYTETHGVEVIPVTDPTAITPAPELRIPRGIFEMETAIDGDLERETSLNLLVASLSSAKSVDTATLALQLQGAAQLETGFRVERLEDYSRRLSRYLGGLLWQKASVRDIGEILGTFPEPEEWLSLADVPPELAKARIRNELLWRVDPGSSKPPVDEAVRREQKIKAIAVMQQTDPLLFAQLSRPIFADLVKDLGFKELEKIVLDALDQRAAAAAQQENQLLLAGHPQAVGEAEDHETHILVHQQAAGQPMVDQHILAHAQARDALLGQQKTAGQGVRQSAAAPSASEVRQMGAAHDADLAGAAMNMREGTGSEAVGG